MSNRTIHADRREVRVEDTGYADLSFCPSAVPAYMRDGRIGRNHVPDVSACGRLQEQVAARVNYSVAELLAAQPRLAALGSTVVDCWVMTDHRHGAGNKHDAAIEMRLGGSAINTASFGPANGIAAAAIGCQAGGVWGEFCENTASAKGIRLLLQGRADVPAASVIMPNGRPGHFDIYTQRLEPPTEFTPEMKETIAGAEAVIVGPMRHGPRTTEFLLGIDAVAPKAYRALIPHRDLVADPAFARVAQHFNFVQINADEATLLDGATRDPVMNACRLRFLHGENKESAVTNGAGRGLLWNGSHWLQIEPPSVAMVDDTGCGDSFTGAYVIGRAFLGLSSQRALEYAVAAAAATATQVGVAKPLPYQPLFPFAPVMDGQIAHAF